MTNHILLKAEEVHYDKHYLRYLLQYERDAELLTFVEQKYPEESHSVQIKRMLEFPFFANKVLDDFSLSYDTKLRKFFNMLSFGKSKIITIIGGRGSGKTAFAMYVVEQLYKEGHHKNVYYVKKGERPPWLPEWINTAQNMEEVPNKSFAILDETVLEYGARNFHTDENKSFTERLVILRHKDTSVMLVTQHSKLIDINIRRLSDILVYKNGANIEQEGAQDQERFMILSMLMPHDKTRSLIEVKQFNNFWVVQTGLASFWDDELVSKTYRDYNPDKVKREQRTKKFHEELEKLQQKEMIRQDIQTIKADAKPKKTINWEDWIDP